ncbi:glycosyltransferase family 2 protein [Romeria aff. gracilis LEGE 07310]|uniref:Glycosyltransferase family 2 protein n=1 Tax=Vasconcelosia minhoensis LEGE 07310 TaxID=915328 RepID=A0A8J7A6N8_9CYAN|nr:hormogonium polysaccharide biosynthesis glycosyltransferase HpsE [Romeria gracilis]MBE9076975.1 glycosyltransferase family 2 protein [Romeria aff. gracilis LEGE 07310]
MPDFTVAIPTYNGAERLPRLLEQLRSQTYPADLDWEILVVDNNSSDQTAALIQQYQRDWADTTPTLRYAFEPQQGAGFARQKAIQTAQSEWVGFLDDDIIPAADWVATAYAAGASRDRAGAYGGQIHGKFETPPPENFKRIQSFLAIRERGPEAHQYDPENLVLPPSAAWVVRRQAWLRDVPTHLALSGPVSGSMVGGEDFEPLLYLHRAGWEIWYNPDLHAAHEIPDRRLERAYLINLSWACGLCICHLRMITAKSYWQKPLIMAKIALGGWRRALKHYWTHAGNPQKDTIAACEMAFFLSSALSPAYFIGRSLVSHLPRRATGPAQPGQLSCKHLET